MRWTVLLAVAVIASAPAPASAARVTINQQVGQSSSLAVLATGPIDAPVEVNDITLTLAADGRVEVHDATAPVDAQNGCEQIDEHRARCPGSNISSIQVLLGAGNDSYHGDLPAGFFLQVNMGSGDDVMLGGAANEILEGGPGSEEIHGGGGHDSYAATYVYDAPGVGARVTLDGQPDDGVPGEGDNVFSDVEDITGTPGPDTIIGSDTNNDITGGGGEDVLQGMGGNDRIRGSGTLSGGLGDDNLVASRNGRVDTVNCGGGQDWADVDQTDLVNTDCRHPAIAGLPYTNMPDTRPIVVPAPARAYRSRYAPVLLACPRGISGPCRGELTLRGAKRVGTTDFRVSRGQIATVRVPLTTYGRRLLARKSLVTLAAQIRTLSGQRQLPVLIRTRRR